MEAGDGDVFELKREVAVADGGDDAEFREAVIEDEINAAGCGLIVDGGDGSGIRVVLPAFSTHC